MIGRLKIETAIAPVIGVVLMVVLVGILAVVSGAMFLSFSNELGDPPAMFSGQTELEMTIENGAITEQSFALVHDGGDTIDVENLRVTIKNNGDTIQVTPEETGSLADGAWSAGETLEIGLNTTEICNGGDVVTIEIVQQNGGQSYILKSQTVPVTTEGFTIVNGGVVPNSNYGAELTILGTGFTYGAGGPIIDIRVDVVIGETRYDPWPGNVNNNGNPRSETFTNQPAGSAIVVSATGDKNGVYVTPRTRWSNESSDGWVAVLKDGDTPPNLAGFGDQDSASTYVQPYLDANGTIDLDANQAIYLFELGNSQTGPAADYQDVVVLASIQTEVTTATVQTVDSSTQRIVCPTT